MTDSHSFARRNKNTQRPWRRYSGSTNYKIYYKISAFYYC